MDKHKEIGCIYCGREDDLSESDIVPDALTNAKIINPNVCHVEHNSKMSDRFESEVIEQLAFLTNYLNIKSSKSSHYAKYTARYVIGDVEYTAKNIVNDDEFTNRPIWTKGDEKKAIGPMKKIKEIAIKKFGNDESVKEVDLNSTEVEKRIKINIDIFCKRQMFRLVAKIAFELYCLQNNQNNYNKYFDDIINFIVEDKGNDVVSIVLESNILSEFDKICTDGSHCFVTYIANNGSVNMLVDMFGIVIYNVKLCDKIYEDFMYNTSIVKLNIDGTRVDIKCKDYNEAFDKMLNIIMQGDKQDNDVFNVGGVNLNVINTGNNNIQYIMFLIELPNYIQNQFKTWKNEDAELFDRIKGKISEILQSIIINKKALIRFVNEKSLCDRVLKLNPKGSNKRDAFIYFIIYLIGKYNLKLFSNEELNKLLENNINKHDNIITEEIHKKILDYLLSDETYTDTIKKGAKLIMDWKEKDNI